MPDSPNEKVPGDMQADRYGQPKERKNDHQDVVPPAEGFLAGLRALTEQEGALLIFDEVMTGFRVALGGAQELYGISPELMQKYVLENVNDQNINYCTPLDILFHV